jgi:N-formylglutamate amidohydrolase
VSLCQRWFVPFPNGALVTVVGDAIDPGPPDRNPSRGRVKKLHAAYVDALLRLIERTKKEAGYPTQETVIV